MATNGQQPNWQDMLRDSSWVTLSWEWFQTLLGRTVDSVLWVTMVFSCYQLIPHAPQAPAGVNTCMFVLQFIALDVGGLSMNQLARRQGLERWAYARVVAYILIGITLVTISYSGVQHAITIPVEVTNWIEVVLVVARSIMTVLYGQAMHSLKEEEVTTRTRLAALETEAPTLREQASTAQQHLSTIQQRVSTLQKELDGTRQEVETLRQQLDTEKERSGAMQQELETGQEHAMKVRKELNIALVQVDTLQAQLDGKKQELAGLRAMLESGQEWQESRVRGMLEMEQQRHSNLQQQLNAEQSAAVELRKQFNAMVVDAEGLRQQLDMRQQEIERVQAALKSEQQTVSSLQQALEAEQQRVSILRQKLEGGQGKGSTGHGKTGDGGQGKVVQLDTARPRKGGQDTAENAIGEQIRELLKAESGLSGRAIAARLGCSPTTATKWKSIIEGEATDCVNE